MNRRRGLDGLRVLVVEDSFLIAEDICDALRSDGCEVIGPVGRVEQAMALLEEKQIDGALLDVNLAGTLSFPIATALRGRSIPFLFLTGYGDPSVIPPELMDVARIAKPFDPAGLVRIVAESFRAGP